MGIFDGILICTDLDGTLLRADKTISEENVRAIAYFEENGGRFTFVTGRMPFYAMDICARINANAPFGCVNGAGVYDGTAGRYLWTCELPRSVLTLVEYIDRHFPRVGIQLNTFDQTFFCRDNAVMDAFRQRVGLPHLCCRYDEIEAPLAKIIFTSDSGAEIEAMERALTAHPLGGDFSFIRSEKSLFEILPKGVGKGTLIRKIAQLMQIDEGRTIAVGDYDNDISMLRAARIGIAVSNACAAAKEAADYLTVSNEEHAIAQVIADLARGKYAF